MGSGVHVTAIQAEPGNLVGGVQVEGMKSRRTGRTLPVNGVIGVAVQKGDGKTWETRPINSPTDVQSIAIPIRVVVGEAGQPENRCAVIALVVADGTRIVATGEDVRAGAHSAAVRN